MPTLISDLNLLASLSKHALSPIDILTRKKYYEPMNQEKVIRLVHEKQ